MRVLPSRLCLLFIVLYGASHLLGQTPAVVYQYQVPTGGYDPAGNLTSYTDTVNGSWTTVYDPLNRLQSATSASGPFKGYVVGEHYDSFGNRIEQTATINGTPAPEATSATYDASGCPSAGTNRVCSTDRVGTLPSDAASGMTGGYDASGNLLSDGIHYFRYDAENRICASYSTVASGVTQYFYDADGNRVAKAASSTFVCPGGSPAPAGAVSAKYLLGTSGEQVTELDGQNGWTHTNVFANGALLATYNPAGLHFPLADPLGTVRLQVVSTGAGSGSIERTCASLPFGDGLVCSGAPDASEHHFTGKEHDAESGLDNFGARYYASGLGRWMSPDWSASQEAIPYADQESPQSLNLYTYVNNNPLSLVDPDGHHEECTTTTSTVFWVDNRDELQAETQVHLACHDVPDWWQFHGLRQWVGNHPRTVQAGFGVINAATVVSGLLDGGASELALPEELIAEESIVEAGEIATEEVAEAGAGKAEQVASEKTAKYFARRIEKELGKDARREFHDEKMSGGGDRTLQQLKDDARAVFEEHGQTPPPWTK